MNTQNPTLLDQFIETPFLQEVHERNVRAPVETCWESLHAVRATELPVYRSLMAVRTLGRHSIEDADLALDSFPPRLADSRPPTELLFVLRWTHPRVDIGMDIRLREASEAGVTRMSTCTRIGARRATSAAIFLPYWVLIRAGSGLIRREMLAAAAQRAETHR